MKTIEPGIVQEYIDRYADKFVYIHLETTNGAYAKHFDKNAHNVGAYIRNAQIKYERGKIVTTDEAYRVGLKTSGWIYAEGLTDYEITEEGQLLLAGHDPEGRLMVALEISEKPFDM
ncbi:YojF family protein [Halalkalibacillus halophilus]|uniref:YojF family protein n=1 Tax=Halalkalibacillus halophilus TaxID=392827 RepID=UPI0003F5AC80|nr:YojF family protein [Halalkalibacillus halophilus]